MKISNLDNAEVPEAKVSDYLLSLTHPDGGGKAGFFTQFGFSSAAWEDLAQALLRHATEHEIAKTEDLPYGLRYVVEGVLRTPDARRSLSLVRGIWRRCSTIRDRLPAAKEKPMIKELDRVVLTADLPEYGLMSGDIGTVVLIHRGGIGYEVEFLTLDGETLAVTSLSASQVRPISPKEIAHARTLELV